MSKMPVMKRELSIRRVDNDPPRVTFWATRDAASDISRFGYLMEYSFIPNDYTLVIDTRYDVEEVVAYIRAYEKGEQP